MSMTYILKMMTLTSMTLTMMKTPLSMGTILMVQTILTIMLMMKMLVTSWFPMITFLMMIGGMMILFMYMSSIASNEKFKMNLNMTFMLLLMMMLTEELIMENQIEENQTLMNLKGSQELLSMMKLYNKKSLMVTVISIMILLLTMISISKIVMHHKEPLRAKTYE